MVKRTHVATSHTGIRPRSSSAPLNEKCVGGTATILRRIQAMVQAGPTFELHGYAQERAVQILDTFNAIIKLERD